MRWHTSLCIDDVAGVQMVETCPFAAWKSSAVGMCSFNLVLQASRQQVLRWLSQNTLDPNDPRNAPLLELMRAHEATSGGMVRKTGLRQPPCITTTG